MSTLSIADYPNAVLSSMWENDQEFPDTPQVRKALNFYDYACARASALSKRAVSENLTKSDGYKKLMKQAVHWQNVQRTTGYMIQLFAVDEDTPLKDALRDPFIE